MKYFSLSFSEYVPKFANWLRFDVVIKQKQNKQLFRELSTLNALLKGKGCLQKKKVHMEGNLPYRGGGGSTKSLVKFKKK